MVAAFRRTSRCILIGLVAALSACGGGGGGGGDDGGVSIEVSPSALTFIAADTSSSAPPSQIVTLTVSGGSAWLGTTSAYGSVINNVSASINGNTTAQVTVTPNSPGNLGVGTHTGSVTVQVCADEFCNSEVAGSPFTINVTYVVGGFSGSPNSISLNAAEGESPVAVSETITNTSGSVAWTTSVVYNGATTNWVTLDATSGSTLPATINVGATTLPPGTYSATMQVTIPGKTLDVPIAYTVSKALAPSPALLGFNLGTTVNAADLSQTVTVGTNYAVGSPKTINWSASSDVPWLSVTSVGNTASQPTLTVTLVQAQLDQMLNGIHWGYITLSSTDANVSDVSIPYSLFIDRAQINYVSPYVAAANSSAEVIIRGKKFSEVTVQNVKFGGTNASAFNVVSDTEIRATHPALVAGQYPVTFTASGANAVSRATLVVTSPATLADLIFLDSSTTHKGIIYDQERNVVLVFPVGGSFIERHTYNGSSWSSTSVTLPYTFNPGVMSPDGKEIVLLTQDNRIVRVDAVTLAELSAMGPLAAAPQAAVAMNDGNVLVGAYSYGYTVLHQFDLVNQPNGYIPIANTSVNMLLSSIHISGDGSRAILNYDNLNGLYSYNAGTGAFAPITAPIAGNINNMDRTGAHILANNTSVYNASLALLGHLPYNNEASNCYTSLAAISPDGTRGYTFCRLSPDGRVYTYDLSAVLVNGYFPAVGSYVVVSQTISGMQISGDGKTLFLVDDMKASVLSLP